MSSKSESSKSEIQEQKAKEEFKRFLDLYRQGKIRWPWHEKYVALAKTQNHFEEESYIIMDLNGRIKEITWSVRRGLWDSFSIKETINVSPETAIQAMKKNRNLSWEELAQFLLLVNQGVVPDHYSLFDDREYVGIDRIKDTLREKVTST